MNMQKKRLLPSTIIPKEFYVERGADKQIRDVVENMGRPGYVLVARQMGKTNLLLNAKNELGREGAIFVYVDLSNVFPDLHQFFRNIIDVAVDSNPEFFNGVEEKLASMREKGTNRPAHKEHEQELRLLLRATPGKLVICLDEIDALKKVEYSDAVFSLIRSTYFASRINYPEFNQLTYILSGVVEPNDIIKNKDISPFNIGEKIYLDDFSRSEYRRFVEKSGLQLPPEVMERIFSWTNGNPRMCWDVCSGLEDLWLTGSTLTEESVDTVVRKLYLTSYNLAPVDHIRQQVTEDKDIRTAIMNIHLDKSSSVTDAQRTKLYLAGIIGSDFSSNQLRIKNRIIEESLSESWIMSIEESNLSLSEAADVRFSARDYRGALKLYKDYLSKLAPDISDNFTFYKAGECCFMLGDYQGTVDYFGKANIRPSDAAVLYFRKHLWLGFAQSQLGLFDTSIDTFKHIIDFPFPEERPIVYYGALINICVPYFQRFEKFGQQILENCEKVIASKDEIRRLQGQAPGDSLDSVLFAAHQNIAMAHKLLGNETEAKLNLRSSMNFANAGGKLGVISELLSTASKDEAAELLITAKSLLNERGTEFCNEVLRPEAKFNTKVYSSLLVNACRFGDTSLAKDLAAPLLKGQYGESVIWPVISTAANVAKARKNHTTASRLYDIALSLPEDKLNKEERKKIYLYVLLLPPENVPYDFDGMFLTDVAAQPIEKFDERDVRIFYELIHKNLVAGHLYRVEKILRIVADIRREFSELTKTSSELSQKIFLPIDFLELQLYIRNQDRLRVQYKAAMIYSQINSGLFPLQYFARSFIEAVTNEVNNILDQFDHMDQPHNRNGYAHRRSR
jgi:tetratricopeptide (TPR) repeat protein